MALKPVDENGHISFDLTLKSISSTDNKIGIEDEIVLQPGFYYVECNEELHLKKGQFGFIDGKSSLSRLGFSIIKTANSIIRGSVTNINIPLRLINPIKIYRDMPVAQIIVSDANISNEETKKAEIIIYGDNADLTLDDRIYKYDLGDNEFLDAREANGKFLKQIIIPKEGIELEPLVLYLGLTNETVSVNNCVAMLTTPGINNEIQTTLLFSIEHASFIKDGWYGKIALEINSYIPGVKIYPNMKIGTLLSLGEVSKNTVPEISKYHDQRSPIQKK